MPTHGARDLGDVLGACAATAAHDIEHPGRGQLAQHASRIVRCLVIATECVGQPGVGIERQERISETRQLLRMGPQ